MNELARKVCNSNQGEMLQRFERALRTDFAYGGLGLNLGLGPGPDTVTSGVDRASLETAVGHLARIAVFPLPRVLCPSHSSAFTKQAPTELYPSALFGVNGRLRPFRPIVDRQL